MKKRCAIYIRTTENEFTRELQLAEITEYARSRDFQVVRVYEDHGVGPKRNRAGLTELLAHAELRKFEFILVWRIDRMFLSARHAAEVLKDLNPMGVGFISVRDGIDTFSEQGSFAIHLFNAFASFDRTIIHERTLAGINGSKQRGAFFGRFDRIDTAEVSKLFAEGLSRGEISRRIGRSYTGVCMVVRKARMAQEMTASRASQ